MTVNRESQGVLMHPCPLEECQYLAAKPDHDARHVRKVR